MHTNVLAIAMHDASALLQGTLDVVGKGAVFLQVGVVLEAVMRKLCSTFVESSIVALPPYQVGVDGLEVGGASRVGGRQVGDGQRAGWVC